MYMNMYKINVDIQILSKHFPSLSAVIALFACIFLPSLSLNKCNVMYLALCIIIIHVSVLIVSELALFFAIAHAHCFYNNVLCSVHAHCRSQCWPSGRGSGVDCSQS